MPADNRYSFHASITSSTKAGVSEDFVHGMSHQINDLTEKARKAATFKPGAENNAAVEVLQQCGLALRAALAVPQNTHSNNNKDAEDYNPSALGL
jgi:hypothetical protein